MNIKTLLPDGLVERRDLQEHVFVMAMLLMAFLYRDNPVFVYPQVLVLLLILLSYNLFQHWYLQRTKNPKVFHAFSLILNTIVVAGIIQFSGGRDSILWVLLLLPLFSSLLVQDSDTMWLTLALELTVLAAFYLDYPLVLDDVDVFSWGTKAAVLTLALVVTKQHAIAERQAKQALEKQRESVHKLEEDFETAGMQAEKMVSLGTLTTSIAHDLNSPIAIILGYCDLLLADLPKGKQSSDVKRIQDAANFCRNLISNILSLARREDYSLSPTRLKDVFENAWSLVETQFRHQQVALVSEFPEDLPNVPVSPVHIQQVMLNLLANACYVSKAGDTVRVRAHRDDGNLAVAIHDQGPGIPEEVKPRLFQAFFTTKQSGKGTGMGLHTSRKIIERHHGKIWAENAPDGGAVFVFTLPLHS